MDQSRVERILGYRAALRFILAEAEELQLAETANWLRRAIDAVEQEIRALMQ